MRVNVLGAGAMGSAFGALLQQAGHAVTLVDRNARHVAAINAHGLRVRTPDSEFTLAIPATGHPREVSEADLVLFFVGSNATAAAARDVLPMLAASGCVLTLQNGLGNAEALSAAAGEDKVLAGSTYVSAAMRAPGHVHVTNIGPTVLGEVAGPVSSRSRKIADLLQEAGLPCQAVENVMGHIWLKFALNCALNPLAAITGLRTGEVVRHPQMSRLLDSVIAEIMAVARAQGLRFPEADPARHIREHARLRYNRPSMLQHIEAGLPTEIDSLNGALLRHAENLGVPVPVNSAIMALVRGIEARAMRPGLIDEAQLERQAAAETSAKST